MNCKKAWTIDTLDGFITKAFRNSQFKEHREKILMDREQSLLPATQPEVLRVKEMDECKRLLRIYRKEMSALKKIMNDTYLQMNGIYRNVETKMTDKVHFSIHCPFKSCKGFVKSDTWQCGLCENSVCPKCHEYIDDDDEEEHKCTEENLKTAQMIKKETKSCPGCSTLIFKISGCNQMWCTQCHTTFSWDTGKIVNGNVHNPHFYEWMRNNQNGQAPRAPPRAIGDVPCGGLISVTELKRLVTGKSDAETAFIYNTHREALHIQEVVMPVYQTDQVRNNLDLRVKFLMDKITDDQFKVQLQQREKKMVRNREIREVLEMYIFTIIDMFNNLQNDVVKTYPTFDKELTALSDFANKHLYKISKRYNATVPLIGGFYVPARR